MVVVVANAWLEAISEIAAGTKGTQKVYFMDGPVAATLSSAAPGVVNVSFTHNEIVVHSIAARIDQVLRDAISAGEHVVAICTKHGWSDRTDYSRLFASVERAIRSLPA